MTNRRGFLAGLLAATAPLPGWAGAGNPGWIACARRGADDFVLCGFRVDGSLTFSISLPARGHAGAAHPTEAMAVAFARRPGAFALVFDCASGNILNRLTPPRGLEFNGHGTFLDDGATLASSEQRTEDSQGFVGLWETKGWTRTGQFPTGGIGPHDLRLMPDGQTLAVANGGIATGPGDREKLNIPFMRPNLSYLSKDGTLLEQVELDSSLHRASIRHLAIRSDGLLAFAMQWEGDPTRTSPLLGLHRRGQRPVLAVMPEAESALMQGYAGSIAWAGDQSAIAITSPRGGRIQTFDADGQFLAATQRTDICGIAPCGAGWICSDGTGGLIAIAAETATLLDSHASLAWDNHIVTL